MTWLDVLLYGPGWLACALHPIAWYVERHFRRRYEQRWGCPPPTAPHRVARPRPTRKGQPGA